MSIDLSNEARLTRCRTALGKVLLHNQDLTEALKMLVDAVERHTPEGNVLRRYASHAKVAIGVDPTGRGVTI